MCPGLHTHYPKDFDNFLKPLLMFLNRVDYFLIHLMQSLDL